MSGTRTKDSCIADSQMIAGRDPRLPTPSTVYDTPIEVSTQTFAGILCPKRVVLTADSVKPALSAIGSVTYFTTHRRASVRREPTLSVNKTVC